ncbi:MAG: dihydrolipoyl dehydrogenase [Bacteroidia bacterium]|nr:dihydrolipoyl dehydrogenase [Bacteroidia bacterium]MDW8157425.1 dihydrolipoyl dehydrogenase [Bacteroidia bacterium]
MENQQFDVAIIGSGPGGYVAALRCAQLGMKTALIERYDSLGGTCLNVGCIPSKALLDSSEHYHNAKQHFDAHGIEISGLNVNFRQMIARKDKVVNDTVAGIRFLMKKNKIETFHGHASFLTPQTLLITDKKDPQKQIGTISARNIIIATGSKPASLPNVFIDKERIITSTEALSLKEIPNELLVIGGGVIGLELGAVYARLGSKVRIVEYSDSLIPSMDRELGKEIHKILRTQLHIEFFMSHKVQQAFRQGEKVVIKALNEKNEVVEWLADYCLVAVGRRPYTEKLGLENIGITLDEKGRIPVNEHLETKVKGIYAIGDVIRGPMLAHKASDEGILVAEYLAGKHGHINYLAIPSVVYTWPEVAGVGYTEEELKAQQTPYKVGKFPFRALGRARAAHDTDGFVKVLAHQVTDEILGIHMIGARCADIIAEAVVAIEFRASAEDIGIFSHPHPTFTEALKEAALAATENRALHI